MNATFGLIRSWHVIREGDRPRPRSLCGLTVYGDIIDALPAGKSCETCLRIYARQQDDDTFRAIADKASDRTSI